MPMTLDGIQALMFISIGIVSVLIGAAESYLCLTIDPEVRRSYYEATDASSRAHASLSARGARMV